MDSRQHVAALLPPLLVRLSCGLLTETQSDKPVIEYMGAYCHWASRVMLTLSCYPMIRHIPFT